MVGTGVMVSYGTLAIFLSLDNFVDISELIKLLPILFFYVIKEYITRKTAII